MMRQAGLNSDVPVTSQDQDYLKIWKNWTSKSLGNIFLFNTMARQLCLSYFFDVTTVCFTNYNHLSHRMDNSKFSEHIRG